MVFRIIQSRFLRNKCLIYQESKILCQYSVTVKSGIPVIIKRSGNAAPFRLTLINESEPVLQVLALDDAFPAAAFGFHLLDSGDVAYKGNQHQ